MLIYAIRDINDVFDNPNNHWEHSSILLNIKKYWNFIQFKINYMVNIKGWNKYIMKLEH